MPKNLKIPPLEQRKKRGFCKKRGQVDVDPLKKVDSMYAEIVDINMVDISEGLDAGDPVEASMSKKKLQEDVEDQFAEKNESSIP